jgi:hypothetical protein
LSLEPKRLRKGENWQVGEPARFRNAALRSVQNWNFARIVAIQTF